MTDEKPALDHKVTPTPELIRTYYQHQYERMAQLENQRQTFTTIILSLSILAFTFGFESINEENAGISLPVVQNIVLLIVIAVANVMAVSYMRRTKSWISSHRIRAKAVLEKFHPMIFHLDTESLNKGWENYQKKEASFYQLMYRIFGGRGRTQEILHWVILISCLTLLIFQIVELF